MAAPTNAYLTAAAAGIREDLTDLITMISPVDTLFFDVCEKGKADQTKHEWQTDALAAAASNAHLEGDTETATACTATTRIYNNCQIQKKVFGVSNTINAVKSAGRKNELAYQTKKHLKELAKDIEYAALQALRADESGATPRQMRGGLNWTTTNLSKASDATLQAGGNVTGGTNRSLTETIFMDVVQTCYDAGGDPDLVLTTSALKRAFSGFAGSGNYRTAIEGKKMNATIDVYESDFGPLTIKPHRGMVSGVVFIVDQARWVKAILRPLNRELLGKVGDSTIRALRIEWTLEAKAENANGRITNVT